jgi:NADH-quinone oxidoreductase subunit K
MEKGCIRLGINNNNMNHIIQNSINNITIVEHFTIAMILFLLGVLGILLNRKNIIIMIMSIEIILLAVNYDFILFSVFLNDLWGQIFSLFILTVAAGESAIGLAILVAYYRVKGTIAIKSMNSMKG